MQTTTAAPLLDHVFLTVSEPTLDAITGCGFLTKEEFGRFRIKEATSTLIGPYRTANVAGISTFVEFFPDSSPPLESVRVGMVLSFSRPGTSARVQRRLTEAGFAFHHELVRRTVEGADEPQPWYHLVRPDLGPDSPFTLFLSEITPEYFARLGALPGPGGTQDRAAYLAAAMRAEQQPEHQLVDVVGVTVQLDQARAELLSRILQLLGYTAHGDRLVGPGVTVVITAGDGPERLRSLRLRLRRAEPRHFELGDSTLRLSPDGDNDPFAEWVFHGSGQNGLRHG